jgi:hypothetical protein
MMSYRLLVFGFLILLAFLLAWVLVSLVCRVVAFRWIYSTHRSRSWKLEHGFDLKEGRAQRICVRLLCLRWSG